MHSCIQKSQIFLIF